MLLPALEYGEIGGGRLLLLLLLLLTDLSLLVFIVFFLLVVFFLYQCILMCFVVVCAYYHVRFTESHCGVIVVFDTVCSIVVFVALNVSVRCRL